MLPLFSLMMQKVQQKITPLQQTKMAPASHVVDAAGAAADVVDARRVMPQRLTRTTAQRMLLQMTATLTRCLMLMLVLKSLKLNCLVLSW